MHVRALIPATALTALLTLSACGSGDAVPGTTATSSSSPSASSSSASGSSPSGSPSTATGAAASNDADVSFAQMMSTHHSQAIQMSDLLLAKSGVDPRVSALAERIKAEQTPEIEQMTALLTGWGAEAPATGSGSAATGGMTGMDMGGMPGMMSAEDMTALESATGPEASRLFLEQMTTHHTGAVEMAKTEVDGGSSPEAIALAQSIITAQEGEIQEMKDLLATL